MYDPYQFHTLAKLMESSREIKNLLTKALKHLFFTAIYYHKERTFNGLMMNFV